MSDWAEMETRRNGTHKPAKRDREELLKIDENDENMKKQAVVKLSRSFIGDPEDLAAIPRYTTHHII